MAWSLFSCLKPPDDRPPSIEQHVEPRRKRGRPCKVKVETDKDEKVEQEPASYKEISSNSPEKEGGSTFVTATSKEKEDKVETEERKDEKVEPEAASPSNSPEKEGGSISTGKEKEEKLPSKSTTAPSTTVSTPGVATFFFSCFKPVARDDSTNIGPSTSPTPCDPGAPSISNSSTGKFRHGSPSTFSTYL